MISGTCITSALLDDDKSVKAIRFEAFADGIQVRLVDVLWMWTDGIDGDDARFLLQETEAACGCVPAAPSIHTPPCRKHPFALGPLLSCRASFVRAIHVPPG